MTGYCCPTCRDRDCPCTRADEPGYEEAAERGEVEPRWKAPRRGERMPAVVVEQVRSRSHGQCEVPSCTQRSTQLHHRLLRKHGGPHTAANLLDVCDFHHGQIHANPRTSYEAGFLVHSYSAEADRLRGAA